MTLRRGARRSAARCAPHTHVHRLHIAPQVALHVRIDAATPPAARVLAPALALRSPRLPVNAMRAPRRSPPPHPARQTAGSVRSSPPLVAAAPAVTAGIALVPRVVRRAAAAAPDRRAGGPASVPAAAAPAAGHAPHAPSSGAPSAPEHHAVPTAEVDRITDQVVATIDRRILARRERLGRM